MKAIFPFLLIGILSIYILSCANQGTPTGGAKDTIPPTLIKSFPTHETINFNKQEFKFVFDEKISADQLKSKLIITPYTENDFKVKVKKNVLTILFEETFQDSTTYTFNFSDGVVDVTEKNSVENFSIAFSTGPYIDSLSISGNIKNLYDDSKGQKMTVSIYVPNDSINVLTGKPLYFTKTDTSGYYQINNIKNGKYRIYAFEDANNNLTAETDTEKHGFLSDTLNLQNNLENVDIPIQLIDATELKYIRSKQTGRYFDIIYGKYIESYNIKTLSDLPTLPKSNLIKENKTLRFYYDSLYRYDMDSLGIQITALDSISNQVIDTTYIKFSESKRKADAFTFNISPANKSKINQEHKLVINFSKPISNVLYDSITLMYDTLIIRNIPDSIYQWNYNRTKLTIENYASKTLLKHHVDSLLETLVDTTALPVIYDSLASDTDATSIAYDSLTSPTDSITLSVISDSLTLATYTIAIDTAKMLAIRYLNSVNTDRITYHLKKGSFISIESDSSTSEVVNYQFKNPEDFGKISGTVSTNQTHYTIQLVNTKYEVIDVLQSVDKFMFEYVPPGKYTFRVLIDDNHDGIWTPGNIHKNIEPESIYFYPEESDMRANWEIENVDISF